MAVAFTSVLMSSLAGFSQMGSFASIARAAGTPGPFQNVADMQVDAKHGLVFVSGGRNSSQVVIYDFNGKQVGTMNNISGPSGMEIVEDVLYIAATGSSSIERYALTSDVPNRLSSISTDPFESPEHLLFTAGRLWFTSNCSASWESSVASVSLGGGDVRELEPVNWPSWEYCARVDGGKHSAGRIFISSEGLSPASTQEYDVTTDPPTLIHEDDGLSGGDLETMPGAQTFLRGNNQGIAEYTTADFSGPIFTYIADVYLHHIAMSDEGTVVGATNRLYETELWIYRLGVATPISRIDFEDRNGRYVQDIDVAPDGSRIFVVLGPYGGPHEFLSIVPDAQGTSTSLTTSTETIRFGESVTLVADVEPDPSGGQITIYKDPARSPSIVQTGDVDEQGRFKLTLQPRHSETYYAEFSGTHRHLDSVSDWSRVEVAPRVQARLRGHYSMDGTYHLYHRDDTIRVATKVSPNKAGSYVHFDLYRSKEGYWELTSQWYRVLGDDSRAAMRLDTAGARGRFRVSVRISPDEDNTSAHSPMRYFKVTR
jgi:hypothetical protein